MSNIDHLNYCKELLNTETRYENLQSRNVISKAYYYVFYEAEHNLVYRLNWEETQYKGGVHARLLSRLYGYQKDTVDEQKKKEADRLYIQISNLKKLRVKSDYKLQLTITRRLAEFSISQAESLSASLQNL